LAEVIGSIGLLAEDVESASELSSPAINQVHALLVNDVESISEVSTPQLVPVSTTPVFRPPSGGSGGGTGRKYKKALRNSRPKKARIGRLEDVTLPSPKIAEEDRLIEEAVKETIKTVVKEAKETSPKLSLKELLSIAASTRESLKKKEKLERLRRLIRIIHIRKEASKRRKKKAQLEAQRLLEEEVRKELERETARRIAEAERKKKEREEQDLRDLMAIIKVVLEAA
jgi:hypothetical protein